MRHRSKSPYGWAIVIVLGIVGGIWLVAEESAYDAAPAPPPWSTTSPADARRPLAKDPASSNVEGRDKRGSAPPVARAANLPGPSVSPPLHLAFQSPSNARVGEAFDVRVSIETHQAVGRIVLDIAFDPALLRLRVSEEVDYTHRTPEGLSFSVERSSVERLSEGRATLVLVPGASTEGSTPRMSGGCRPVRSLGARLGANRHRKYRLFRPYGPIPFVEPRRAGKAPYAIN